MAGGGTEKGKVPHTSRYSGLRIKYTHLETVKQYKFFVCQTKNKLYFCVFCRLFGIGERGTCGTPRIGLQFYMEYVKMGQKPTGAVRPGRKEKRMRIIGIVPGAKLFGSEDLYADQYLFVNGYPKRILANGGTPVGILSSDGYAAQDSLALCDAFVFCGGARFYPYHFQVMEYAAKSGKPVLGICLGMQMMNTYFLVAEEAERRGWDGPLLALFE